MINNYTHRLENCPQATRALQVSLNTETTHSSRVAPDYVYFLCQAKTFVALYIFRTLFQYLDDQEDERNAGCTCTLYVVHSNHLLTVRQAFLVKLFVNALLLAILVRIP